MTCLREIDVVFLKKYGVQKALLAQIQSAGSLCLLEPAEVYQEIIGLGLLPLFIDPPVNTPISTVLLNLVLWFIIQFLILDPTTRNYFRNSS